jgi:hypothetical protein
VPEEDLHGAQVAGAAVGATGDPCAIRPSTNSAGMRRAFPTRTVGHASVLTQRRTVVTSMPRRAAAWPKVSAGVVVCVI